MWSSANWLPRKERAVVKPLNLQMQTEKGAVTVFSSLGPGQTD